MHAILQLLLFLTTQTAPTNAVVVKVDRDNVEITQSCTIEIAATPIVDADGNGVIHITADNAAVDFKPDTAHLHGAKGEQLPDSFAGTGIRITGKRVTLRGTKISGFKVGVHAIEATDLVIEHCDVSGNFCQRLKSTPKAEDQSDWLWPHANDNHEWITNYGAGICVERASNVTLRNIKARRGQNGIILDRVDESKVYDCDCSFLSGWGLAMWRSNKNVISRNAFDFCIRGYSHGVYNRGQDSAGILMFEQCCDNVIAENSATHCGDGFFGFAGKEALGEVNPREELEWYKGRGCNANTFVGNDFSHAAAHGLELTFSFKNHIHDNTFRNNAICGIWGGYSQATIIDHNRFARNGSAGYGRERGGINIEHGRYTMIGKNEFASDACGVFLWWDADEGLLRLPWATVNEPLSSQNFVLENRFADMLVAVQLTKSDHTNVASNQCDDVQKPIEADDHSLRSLIEEPGLDLSKLSGPAVETRGVNKPVDARNRLNGREHIIMTEWGPWNHESPLIRLFQRGAGVEFFELHNVPGNTQVETSSNGIGAHIEQNGERTLLRIINAVPGVRTYEVTVKSTGFQQTLNGVFVGGTWSMRFFPWVSDPRENVGGWRLEAEKHGVDFRATSLDLPFGHGGPSELKAADDNLRTAQLPWDRFGTIATATLDFTPGRWRLSTTSDDGIRVWLDDELVIDDWTWHPPRESSYVFEVKQNRPINVRVEHFEIDGYATLQLEIESAE